jgi:hypothetical protein
VTAWAAWKSPTTRPDRTDEPLESHEPDYPRLSLAERWELDDDDAPLWLEEPDGTLTRVKPSEEEAPPKPASERPPRGSAGLAQ